MLRHCNHEDDTQTAVLLTIGHGHSWLHRLTVSLV